MDLIYINSGIGSVFSSQVIALLNYYYKSGKLNKITLLCGIRNENEQEKASQLLSDFQFQIMYFKTYPNYIFFNNIQKKTLNKAILLAKPDRDTIFHIRGELTAFFACNGITKAGVPLRRVLVDVRGAGKEEILEYQEKFSLLKFFKLYNINKSILSLIKFGRISSVSESLKEYLLRKTQLHENSISVVPCLASEIFNYSVTKRQECRKQLGLNGQEYLLVFSSGGSAGWQNKDVLPKIADMGFKILNLSTSSIDHPNIINKHIPYHLVPAYLSAADIAIIFRDKSIVNEVASPVKFVEYVCTGLPVITNRNVDLITQYIEKTGHGILVDGIDSISKDIIQHLASIPRDQICNYGKKYFYIDVIALKYIQIYKIILNSL